MKKITIKMLGLLFGIFSLFQVSAQCNLNASISYTLGPNGVVNFSSTTTGTVGTTYYQWNYGNSNTGFGIAPTHTYNTNGNYTVVLTAINGSVNPPCQSSATVVITISSFTSTPCNLVANCSYSFGPNGNVYIVSNTSTGTVAATTYTINFGDNTTGNTIPTMHTYSANGAYTVTLTASNNFTNSCISTKTFVVNYSCFISVVSTASAICAGKTVTLVASGSNNYLWSNGGTGPVVFHSPLLTTVYTVSNQTFPCLTTTAAITVIVHPSPSITAASSPSAVCLGKTATLTAGGASTYSWSTGDQTASATVVPVTNSVFTVSGTNTQGCVSSQTLALSVLPAPVISISPANPTVCAGAVISLSASGAASYVWKPANTSSNPLSFSPGTTDTYTVEGTDANNCTSQAVFNVVVYPCTGIGTNTGVKDQVTIYPNPSQGVFIAEFGSEDEKEILVINSLGSIIAKLQTTSAREQLDLSSAGKGIYFVRVSAKTFSSNYRIIIQ